MVSTGGKGVSVWTHRVRADTGSTVGCDGVAWGTASHGMMSVLRDTEDMMPAVIGSGINLWSAQRDAIALARSLSQA